MAKEKTVCFTGPRPDRLYGYVEGARQKYRDISQHISVLVEHSYEEGYDTFISGGAQGLDQLAFWGVHKAKERGLRVRNILYLPFEGQEKIWSPSGLFGQSEYQKMKSLADEICYTTEGTVRGKYDVIRALHHRNHCMVNDSSFVIALLAEHNRDYRNSSGGTAECVRYAVDHGATVYAIQFRLFQDDIFAGDFL